MSTGAPAPRQPDALGSDDDLDALMPAAGGAAAGARASSGAQPRRPASSSGALAGWKPESQKAFVELFETVRCSRFVLVCIASVYTHHRRLAHAQYVQAGSGLKVVSGRHRRLQVCYESVHAMQMNGSRSCKPLLLDEWNERCSGSERLSMNKLKTALAHLNLKPGVMTASQVREPTVC